MKIKCKICGTIVKEPTEKWKMNYCKCKKVALDKTGESYRIVGDARDWELIK